MREIIMSKLYSIQPDREPIEFTHFDQWKSFNGRPDFLPREFKDVVDTWGATLECKYLDAYVDDLFEGSYEQALGTLGFDNMMGLVILNIMSAGYDVYSGDNFIEIYEGDENE